MIGLKKYWYYHRALADWYKTEASEGTLFPATEDFTVHLSATFEIIVTAEQVRSYKPHPAHFEEARRLIGSGKQWVHVAASSYHDIEPAKTLGIRAVWVDRKKPATATSPATQRVGGLEELADWLEA